MGGSAERSSGTHDEGEVAGATLTRLATALTHLLDAPLPFRVRSWDGETTAEPSDAPVLVVRNARALRRLLWRPDRLGLARAWISGDIDVDGDLADLLTRLIGAVGPRAAGLRPSGEARAELMSLSVLLGAVGGEPVPPAAERALDAAETPDGDGPDVAALAETLVRALFDERGVERADTVLGRTRVDAVGRWTAADPGWASERVAARFVEEVAAAVDAPSVEHLLDVAPGWGGLAVALVGRGVDRATCVARSQQQRDAISSLAERAGLAERVRVVLPDELGMAPPAEETSGTIDDAGPLTPSGEADLADVVLATSMAVATSPHPGSVTPEPEPPVARRRLRQRTTPPPMPLADPVVAWAQLLRPLGVLLTQRIVGSSPIGLVPSWIAAAYPIPEIPTTSLGELVTDLEASGLAVCDVHCTSDGLVRSADAWLHHQRAALSPRPMADDEAEGTARAWALALAVLGAQARTGTYRVATVVARRAAPVRPTLQA